MASIFQLEEPTFGRKTTGKTVVAGANEATTLTAAQCIESIVVVTPTAGRAYTTATAALILAELGTNALVGQTFSVTIVNKATATHAVTFTAGSGVTIEGDAVVAAASSGTFIGRVASDTAVVFYRA